MTQYVIQIENNAQRDGWLAKCFKVDDENPVPTSWPTDRIQVVLTNTLSYNSIVDTYETYGWDRVHFSYDEPRAEIDCIGAETDSWPKD